MVHAPPGGINDQHAAASPRTRRRAAAGGPDDKLYISVGGAFQFAETGQYAQDPTTHFGKLLRLNDDGTAPDDNPFAGETGGDPSGGL